MSRYLTVEEISRLWSRPPGTVRRLASVDKWQRTEDHKRPVLYLITDVEKSMDRQRGRKRRNLTNGAE
jgi:hypothetical protein